MSLRIVVILVAAVVLFPFVLKLLFGLIGVSIGLLYIMVRLAVLAALLYLAIQFLQKLSKK